MRVSWLAGLAVSAVVVVAAPARGEEWTKQYRLDGRASLQVKTDDGSVLIEPGPAGEIAARVTTEGWRIAPGEVTIEESQSGSRVEIAVRLPKGDRHWFGHLKHSILVALVVPEQIDAEVDTGDGSIETRSVAGRIKLATGDGSITAGDLEGDIRLHTGDGSIRAQGLSGRLEANTGDGHMNVRGRFELLQLRTGDGGIEAVVEPGSKIETAWSLGSGDGGITLRLPADLGADLDASTGDGRIQLDEPVTVMGTISQRSVHGKIGGGGNPLKIHTGDGSIHIEGH